MFPLAKPVVKDGRNVFDKSQRVEGKVTRIGYESPAHRSLLEVYRNYRERPAEGRLSSPLVLRQQRRLRQRGTHSAHLLSSGGLGLGFRPPLPRGKVAPHHRRRLHQCACRAVSPTLNRGPFVAIFVAELKPMEGGLVTVDAAALASDITATGHSAVYGIYFDTAKAEVKPESDAALKEIAKLLQQTPTLKLFVVGHTDTVGTLASNMDLSKRRADAVVAALTTKYGVASARLVAQGCGPARPGRFQRLRGWPRQEPPCRTGHAVGRRCPLLLNRNRDVPSAWGRRQWSPPRRHRRWEDSAPSR